MLPCAGKIDKLEVEYTRFLLARKLKDLLRSSLLHHTTLLGIGIWGDRAGRCGDRRAIQRTCFTGVCPKSQPGSWRAREKLWIRTARPKNRIRVPPSPGPRRRKDPRR